MLPQSLPRVAVVVLFGAFLISTGCSSSPPGCPVCGTDKNGTVGLIGVMAVPGHSASGAPGGPFNLFDISWVDASNHLYYVSDTVGADVASFNTINNIALGAIGGDSSIAESGNNASLCFQDASGNEIIPPITTAQESYRISPDAETGALKRCL